MKKIFAILAVFALGTGVLACDFGEEDDATTFEEDDTTVVPEDDTTVVPEDDTVVPIEEGDCTSGQSAGLFFVRIADDLDNATLGGDCGAGNPGADIDAIVLVRPDGTEFFAATVEEDADVAGGVCDKNDKDDINTVIGQPDGCAKDLGCGCGDHGYPTNPECDCAGGDSKWVGYYSLNGGAIIVSFDQGAELLCGDQVAVYEMYNPEVAGSEETYQVAYGDDAGNFIGQADYSTGTGVIDVSWEW